MKKSKIEGQLDLLMEIYNMQSTTKEEKEKLCKLAQSLFNQLKEINKC